MLETAAGEGLGDGDPSESAKTFSAHIETHNARQSTHYLIM